MTLTFHWLCSRWSVDGIIHSSMGTLSCSAPFKPRDRAGNPSSSIQRRTTDKVNKFDEPMVAGFAGTFGLQTQWEPMNGDVNPVIFWAGISIFLESYALFIAHLFNRFDRNSWRDYICWRFSIISIALTYCHGGALFIYRIRFLARHPTLLKVEVISRSGSCQIADSSPIWLYSSCIMFHWLSVWRTHLLHQERSSAGSYLSHSE